MFYDPHSSLSCWSFKQWILSNPLTINGDTLASYQQIELVILGLRLAFRGLWIAQFPNDYTDVPLYIISSPYPFTKHEQLSTWLRISYLGLQKHTSHFHMSCTISNYFFRLKEITTAYPANPVRLLKALVTKDSGGKQWDAPSNNHNWSDNVRQSSKVISKDAKHDNKGQNKWYVHLYVDAMDTQTHVPPQASRTFWHPPNLATTSWGSWSCWRGLGIIWTQWQALAALWLHTEAILSKAAQSDLSLDEICSSDIPDTWKDWMNAKQSKVNAQTPSDTFRQVLTDYLASLPSSTGEVGGSIMKQVWCQPGKMGIFGLLLCLYLQAEYAGAGDDWDKNLKCVENIFNAILSDPGL